MHERIRCTRALDARPVRFSRAAAPARKKRASASIRRHGVKIGRSRALVNPCLRARLFLLKCDCSSVDMNRADSSDSADLP